MKIDLARLEALVNMMEKQDLGELELTEGDSSINLELAPLRGRRRLPEADLEESGVTITSARVGIFLKRVSVGTSVRQGDLLAELRVMDVKYRVTSPVKATVEEIFVEDGMGVEYGQPLIKLNLEAGLPVRPALRGESDRNV